MENIINKQLLVSGFNLFHQIDFSDSTRRFGFEKFSPPLLIDNDDNSSHDGGTSLMMMSYGENIVNVCGSLFYNMYLTNFGRIFMLGNFHITDHVVDDSARDVVGSRSSSEQQQQLTMINNNNQLRRRFYELSNHSSLIHATKIVQMACGRDYSLLLTHDGCVFSFGNNLYNQCGHSLSTTLSGRVYFPNQIQSPVQVELPSRVSAIACGQKHSILVMSDRKSICCFGDNSYGQLGIGHTESKPTIHFISLLTAADDNDYIEKVECGGFHSIVLTRNGRVFVFGRSMEGQLGFHNSNNSTTTTSVPLLCKPTILKVFKERNFKVKSVACGEMHSLFLTHCGQVFACGSNYKGELGLGKQHLQASAKHVTEPTRIEFGKNNYIESISCGSCHSLAVSRDGCHFAFGQNQEGQLALKGGSRFEFEPKIVSINEAEAAVEEQLSTLSFFSNSSCFCSFLIRGVSNNDKRRLREFFIKLTNSLSHFHHRTNFADCSFILSS